MVSRKQHVLVAILIAGACAPTATPETTGKKFYPDDPLWKEPVPHNVSQVKTRKIDDIYDLLENSYVTPGREGKAAKRDPRRALDVNTLGEVPDNSWYTNRHASRRMSIEEMRRGPGSSTPPRPNGGWSIVGAKSDGVTPGFVIEDQDRNRYLLKFDPPGHPELSSAADVIGSKFFYALGYATPENYIVHFRKEQLTIPAGATWKDTSGRKHPLTREVVDGLLKSQPLEKEGTYRALASRWLPETVGPFAYRGTRSDDPNDTIPHEDRRVLRGLGVFAAWLNHHDTRSINSMDTIVEEGGRRYLKHHLIDFGSILGSAGDRPKEPWNGHEYAITGKSAAVQAVTLSLHPPRWVRANYPKYTGVGLFDSWSFDPMQWKSNYPNPAFLMMDREDAFWAAKQVAAFSDAEIRAIVKTGEFSDPRAEKWIADCLIARRDKIASAWFSAVLPLDNFRVTQGRLEFDNLAAKSAPAYEIHWAGYDNDLGTSTPLTATGAQVPSSSGQFIAATISCGAPGTCVKPVNVFLRRAGSSFAVVGIER